MKFAQHETFYFREGWLTKGLRVLEENGRDVFLRKDAMELLGIGSNMVKSLRYWMQATGLTKEPSKGRKFQENTDFGDVVYKYDRYFEDRATLWLLHYNLAKNYEFSSTWYWFFNVFNYKEFDEGIFLGQLSSWVSENGLTIADSSLKKDFDCLINSYLITKDWLNANPEDNITCPLRELGLIEYADEKQRIYRITRREVSDIPLEVILYCLLDFADSDKTVDKKHISIDELLSKETSIGRIFSLGLNELIYFLENLQEKGLIYITKTAGLNNVTINYDEKPINFLEQYYKNRQGS